MQPGDEAVGAILAGGLGARIGGAKAIVELAGRPLISYPAAVLRDALRDVVVLAKPDSELPELTGVVRWNEPPQPRHPLVGIVAALRQAARPVLVCAADMPFVTRELLAAILTAERGEAPAVIPIVGGALQPMLALYLPGALEPLSEAVGAAVPEPLREAVMRLGPRLLEMTDERPFFNVNSPADLLSAEAILSPGRYPNVKS